MDWKKLYEEELEKVASLENEKKKALENFRKARTITEQQNADKYYQQVIKEIPVHKINANVYYQNAIEAGQIVEEPEEVIEEPEIEEVVDEPEGPSMTAEEVFSALTALMGGTKEIDDAHDEKDDI